MNLSERLTLYQVQYETLMSLGEVFMADAAPEMEVIEDLLVERERCILTMQKDPLTKAEQQSFKQLAAQEKRTSEEEQLLARYLAVKALNRRVVAQDQAITLRMRGIQQKNGDGLKNAETHRKVNNYGKMFQNGIDAGARFNRLR